VKLLILVLQQHFTAVSYWPNFSHEMDRLLLNVSGQIFSYLWSMGKEYPIVSNSSRNWPYCQSTNPYSIFLDHVNTSGGLFHQPPRGHNC